MNLYREESSSPLINAQRNLDGRTHYVDSNTLRFHKSRILSTYVIDNGLLFALVESCAADMHNRKRVFRAVVFDVFGSIVYRPDFENSFLSCAKATKDLWDRVNVLDVRAITLEAIKQAEKCFAREMMELKAKVTA